MIRARLPRLLGWAAVLALLFPWSAGNVRPGPRSPLAQRLLGPAASLAASVYWIRFDLALRNGEQERAYVLADEALALDPYAPEGWHTLARHLIFDRASLESEPDADRRRKWIVAGLALLERGERETSDPGQLAYLRGTILALYVSEIAGAIGWAGGPERALEDGIRALERARELGFARAVEILDRLEPPADNRF